MRMILLHRAIGGATFVAFVVIISIFPARAADFYFKFKHEKTWQTLGLKERVAVISKQDQRGMVQIEGQIEAGDFDQLAAMHALVPIHWIEINSPGGSVAEALKIISFIEQNSIFVTVGSRTDEKATCASACAFILLGAPVRYVGDELRLHRPYFDAQEFGARSDADALGLYRTAADEIRRMLLDKGYAPEFINRIFSTPRQAVFAPAPIEIAGFPIDAALDELTSARCYKDKEPELRKMEALHSEWRSLEMRAEALSRTLPNGRSSKELQTDPLYRDDSLEHDRIMARLVVLFRLFPQYDKLGLDFRGCKSDERRMISIRKAGGARVSQEAIKIAEHIVELVNVADRLVMRERRLRDEPTDHFRLQSVEESQKAKADIPVALDVAKSAMSVRVFDYIMQAIPAGLASGR